MTRIFAILPLVACMGVVSCAEQRLDCGTDAVVGTLSSIVRDRIRRIAADTYPPSFDAQKRAALTKATRVTSRSTKLIEWDKGTGRLVCVARIVVDAPGPEIATNVRSETDLRYRVSLDALDTFIVEVAYTDIMTLFPVRAVWQQEGKPAR